MSAAILTVRLEEAEAAQLDGMCKVLDRSKSDVVRLGLQALAGQQKQAAQLAEIEEGLRTEMRAVQRTNALQIRQLGLVLMRTLKAPAEAEAALLKVFQE